MKKFITCFTNPKMIGMYVNERLWKPFLELFIFLLVCLLPYYISLVRTTELYDSAVDSYRTALLYSNNDLDFKLENGKLTGTDSFLMKGSECYVFINPNGLELDQSKVIAGSPIVVFQEDTVIVTILGMNCVNVTYDKLTSSNIDFKKITNDKDISEFRLFVGLMDSVFSNLKTYWVVEHAIINTISYYVMIICIAIISTFFIYFINPRIQFKFRFHICLNCTFVYALFIMFMYLFQMEFIEYIGMIVSFIYMIIAVGPIMKIEIRKGGKQ